MDNLDNPFTTKEDSIVEEAPKPVVEENSEPVKVEEKPIEIVEEKKEDTVSEPTAITTTDFAKSTSEVEGVGPVANGAIGVTTMPKAPAKKAATKKPAKEDSVAIFSTRNVTWEGVGKVYRGYNIVSKEAADQWLTRNHVRIATPEEVAREFGK